MKDFIFNGTLSDLDRDVFELSQIEAERQVRKLIMIPSESTAPLAVRETLATAFQNVYAEGYPGEEMRSMTEPEILNLPARLADYRRYSDPRFYKGVEYVDVIESLARRRCAELFAANGKTADEIFVNVQPLSGAPANNAVYPVVANPGDTILAMSLLHGGHLSHGSSVNRSGKNYKIVHYLVDPVTEKIDYDAIQALATEHKPKMIISGFTSYPWMPDWARFRQIADSVGAILLADISHIAGMVAAGVVASPVGYAHIISFTTHKTLCGPRGAVLLTTDSALAKKIDKSIFPGEQGGPHVNVMAALALTFKIARTDQFKQLQRQIVKNCAALVAQLQKRGLRIPYGGTDTHLMNLDCRTITGPDGTPLSGDMAARILDLAGIVANRNTIPGDKSSLSASGIRMGTPWLTQRGFKEKEMVEVADIIADLLLATKPYTIETRKGPAQRAKIDFNVFEEAKLKIRRLAEDAGKPEAVGKHGYPYFFFLDDASEGNKYSVLECRGEAIREFLNYALTSPVEALKPGESQPTRLITAKGAVDASLTCIDLTTYHLTVASAHFGLAATWLRDLSDGFTAFDSDPSRRMPGPVVITEILSPDAAPLKMGGTDAVCDRKPYFIGMNPGKGEALPRFTWTEQESPVRKTALNEIHRKLGAKMVPFAGWDMPVWYSSVVEEHHATRTAAGLFDVSHMGVYQAEGPDAAAFLDSVCGNDIAGLAVGESCYTHFLTPEAEVIDDTLVYHRGFEKYLVVVNASNDDKDWAWLNAVKNGAVLVDAARPWVKVFGRGAILRNLRDPKEGRDMRVDIALQGPKSRDILLSMGIDAGTRKRIMALKRTELCEAVVGGFDLVVSRTGYTGEKMAFELFVHPEQSPALWNAIMSAGEPVGLKACGLGARDSLRTEAGLPLYGHEMSGDLGLGVAEAGFGSYVKTYKPWFIGRDAYIQRESLRTGVVVRFRFTEKGIRMAHHGDPVVDKKGKMIGKVTSCAIDGDGYLTGQAYLEKSAAMEGTQIAVYQGTPKAAGKNPPDLTIGDKVILPTPAEVISRFPKG
jgi:glycine hydroxymethyltransferase